MGMDEQRRWLKRASWRESARMRLFCFHCAGGSAAMFRDWPLLLSPVIEPVAVQLPGRLDRFSETPYESMEPLVDKLAEVMGPLLDEPFACYGASMGARVAWRLAHLLRERSMPQPRALYVATNVAPSVDSSGQEWNQPDSRLLAYLRELGGTPPEILADPDLVARLLAVLRADLTLLATHAFQPPAPLDIPITAFAGSDDAESPPAAMNPWRAETRECFGLHIIPGGHFFAAAGQRQVLDLIGDQLAGALDDLPLRP
jgi:medium-chain acyl-[acyl-carrier-protein] hydrolase